MSAAAISALIAALTQTGLNVFTAIQQANAINAAGADPTPAQWAALDAALSAALNNSALYEASIATARAKPA